ncbi:hypothetical protein Tco_1104917 [Tanacetum coccineum]
MSGSPDLGTYWSGPEHPPSPDYVLGPEHLPSPVEHLPVDASPTALSPGYVAEFDPDEDLEEDPEEGSCYTIYTTEGMTMMKPSDAR